MLDYSILFEDKTILSLLVIIAVTFTYQLVHLIVFRKKFSSCKTKYTGENQNELPPVSIVVCIRDNFPTVKQNIPFLFNQEYPEFEIVIVNYSSNDNETMEDMFYTWAKQNDRLTIVKINETSNFECSKIYPLAVGIKSAKYDLILTTDINCKPATIHWLRSMVSKINRTSVNVAGISNFTKKNTFFNKLMRYEWSKYNINLFSYLKISDNYFVDSKNFLFTKREFLKQNDLHAYFTTANDGCVIFNKMVNKRQTGTMLNDYANIIDSKKYSFSSWFNIITNRFSNFRFTGFKTKLFKALYVITFIVFFTSIVILPIINFNLIILLLCCILFIGRFVTWYFTKHDSLLDLGQNDLNINIILYELILLFLYPINYLISLTIRKNLWI